MKRLLAWGVVVLAFGLVPVRADAAAPRDQGWWTVTNPVPAPDVPTRGLLVQGGGGGAPTAFAAVLYELDPGTTAGTLTLAIAPNTATTPSATLQVCGLLQPIVHPDQGGPMSNAPPYDCSRKATAAPEGNAYKFDASGLVADNVVGVAILPNGPLDRVVLNAPDDSSLATQQALTDTSAGATDASTAADAAAGAQATTPDVSTSSAPIGTDAGSVSLPGVSADGSSSVAPAPAAVPPPSAGASTAGAFVPTSSTAPEKATPVLVVLLVLAVVGAGTLWLYAGRRPPAAIA